MCTGSQRATGQQALQLPWVSGVDDHVNTRCSLVQPWRSCCQLYVGAATVCACTAAKLSNLG